MNFSDLSQKAKQAAAKAAAELVQDGMLVGLGTGSTAGFFIESLIERCRNGLKVQAVPTSERSANQAIKGGIPLCDIDRVTSLDLTVDGADEIDSQKRMIKGGGGALLREKIVAGMSREMVVVVDEGKLVDYLGNTLLPLEIATFAHAATLHKVCNLGYRGSIRITPDGRPYFTDNGNYIIDVAFDQPLGFPEEDQKILQAIPGVLETGFFFGLAGRVIVGRSAGVVEVL